LSDFTVAALNHPTTQKSVTRSVEDSKSKKASKMTALPETTDKAQSSAPNAAENGHVGDKFEVPAFEEHSSFDSLKERIRHHYELASDYYYSLWQVLKIPIASRMALTYDQGSTYPSWLLPFGHRV
jgi:predicted transcriptional regulator